MEILKELTYIVTRYKIRHIEVLGNDTARSTTTSSRYTQFYNALVDEKVSTDEEAAALFGLAPDDRSYKRLKGGLIDKMLNTVFFIDVDLPGFDPVRKAYYTSWKDISLVRILRGRGMKESFIKIAKTILKKSIKFDFPILAMEAANILKNYYFFTESDTKKYFYYNGIFEKYLNAYQNENLAQKYYVEMITPMLNSVSNTKASVTKANKMLEKLEKLEILHKSNSFLFYFYSIATTVSMFEFDYEKTLHFCDKGIREFEERKNTPVGILSALYHQRATCLTQLGEFQRASNTLDKSLGLFHEGIPNWFKSVKLYYSTR